MLCCGVLTGTWGLPCTPFPKTLTARDQSYVNLSHKNSNPDSNWESKWPEKELCSHQSCLLFEMNFSGEGGLKSPQLFISLCPDSNESPPLLLSLLPENLWRSTSKASLEDKYTWLSSKQVWLLSNTSPLLHAQCSAVSAWCDNGVSVSKLRLRIHKRVFWEFMCWVSKHTLNHLSMCPGSAHLKLFWSAGTNLPLGSSEWECNQLCTVSSHPWHMTTCQTLMACCMRCLTATMLIGELE